MKTESDQIILGGEPVFKKPIPSTHHLSQSEGVYSVLTDAFKIRLEDYLRVFEEWRVKTVNHKLDTSSYEDLPYALNDQTWRARQDDIELVNNLISEREQLTILELGSWQGWLANQLSKKGHNVLAVDYFADEYDGLKARKHYKNPKWCSLQLDVEDLHLLNPIFDLIIFNRNLCYCPGFTKSLQDAKKLLKPRASIVATGVNIVKRPHAILQHFEQMETFFRQRGVPAYLKEDFKKYLCHDDLLSIKEVGFELNEYRLKWYQKLKNTIDIKASKHFWALHTS